jgi:hypothetical protein
MKLSESRIYLPLWGNAERQRNFTYTARYYRVLGIPITKAGGDSKAQALNSAIAKTPAQKLIIIDSDFLVPLGNIKEGLKMAGWIIPYSKCRNLSKDETAQIINEEKLPDSMDDEHRPNPVGGAWIISLKDWNKVGGLDERFKGWGGEDASFFWAASTILGEPMRLGGTAYHLYHEPCPTKALFRRGENYKLWQQYRQARGKREEIKKLIGNL